MFKPNIRFLLYDLIWIETRMWSSLGLGIVGGVITFLVGGFEFIFGHLLLPLVTHMDSVVYLTGVSFLAGTMGIVGEAFGKKKVEIGGSLH
jgi:hypothetical protein